jgi:hypothetical protein
LTGATRAAIEKLKTIAMLLGDDAEGYRGEGRP